MCVLKTITFTLSATLRYKIASVSEAAPPPSVLAVFVLLLARPYKSLPHSAPQLTFNHAQRAKYIQPLREFTQSGYWNCIFGRDERDLERGGGHPGFSLPYNDKRNPPIWFTRFHSTLRGQESFNLGPVAAGISYDTGTTISALLEEWNVDVVSSFIQFKRLSYTSIQFKISGTNKWFEIGDGNFSHQAILFLMNTKVSWKRFERMDPFVTAGRSTEMYRQLALFQPCIMLQHFMSNLRTFCTTFALRSIAWN